MNSAPSAVDQKKIEYSRIFNEAWSLVPGLKGSFFLVFILGTVMNFCALIFAIFLSFIFGPIALSLAIIPAYMMFFAMAIMTALSIRQSRGLEARLALAISDCTSNIKQIFYLSLIWVLILGVYFDISNVVIPHLANGALRFLSHCILYLVFLYFILPIHVYSLPAIMFEKKDALSALSTGFDVCTAQYVPLVICSIGMSLIVLISAIPIGVGLIWTLPMTYCLYAILFKILYVPDETNKT